jgi:tetratricopeptide (TPR) repeat protein
LGFIVGFMMASTMSQRAASPATSTESGQLPANHPPLPATEAQNPQQDFAQVQAAISKARNEPQNFDAQVTAAKLEYQIQRYDQAIEFLLKANQIQPSNLEVVIMLGEANMDAGHLDVAEKWYKAAAAKKPDDVSVLSSLAYINLQRGNADEAEKAIKKLEKVSPTSPDLPQFRTKLESLKSGK